MDSKTLNNRVLGFMKNEQRKRKKTVKVSKLKKVQSFEHHLQKDVKIRRNYVKFRVYHKLYDGSGYCTVKVRVGKFVSVQKILKKLSKQVRFVNHPHFLQLHGNYYLEWRAFGDEEHKILVGFGPLDLHESIIDTIQAI